MHALAAHRITGDFLQRLPANSALVGIEEGKNGAVKWLCEIRYETGDT
jgi:hypothetical protein